MMMVVLVVLILSLKKIQFFWILKKLTKN